MSQNNKYLTALKAAFPYTIPIFAGFTFLGMTYGIYMNVSGFSFWYPMLMSMTIFAGSMEFVAVNLLLGEFLPCNKRDVHVAGFLVVCHPVEEAIRRRRQRLSINGTYRIAGGIDNSLPCLSRIE